MKSLKIPTVEQQDLEILENFKRKKNMEVKEGYISVINAADRIWEDSLVSVCQDGELILAYKNTDADLLMTDEETLYQVIVKRLYNNPTKRKYTVSVVTSLRSYTLSMLPKEYLLEELATELENFKVGGKVIANFKQIIEDIED